MALSDLYGSQVKHYPRQAGFFYGWLGHKTRTAIADLPTYADWEDTGPFCGHCGDQLSDVGFGCPCVASNWRRAKKK
jgi:NADH pyrophosphatase NudC (nudix superfamily)